MNRHRIFCLILFCVSLKLQSSPDFLSRLDAYAQHTLEYPEIDNVDWEKPDFTSFYSSQQPSIWSRFKNFFGLQDHIFDLTELERMLQELTMQRKDHGFSGEFVQKLVFADQGRLVIFGDLQGAYHSLVRSLKYLVTQDVLSHELMIQEATYIVFNGNVIDAAAYNLEALMTVLILMQKNPGHVIYIRGKNESNTNKENSKLYHQLSIIAPGKADTLFDQIIAFFDTLPMTLYVRRDDNEVLKIFSQVSNKFDEERLGRFLTAGKDLEVLHAGTFEDTRSGLRVGAIIESYDYSRTLGLKRYVGPPTTWQVFSSPTGAHRRLYGFFNDAFAMVDSAIHFHDWMITLYVNDLQTSIGFDVLGTYNLSTGVFVGGKQIDFFDGVEIQKFESILKEKKKELEELKVACKSRDTGSLDTKKHALRIKQTLSLGSSADLSKASKVVGQTVKDTFDKVFENQNKKGGIQNVFFRTIFLDDAYSPDEARNNYKKLIDDLKVDILFAPLGTATTKESLDFVQDGRAALFFPLRTESSIFRTSELKNAVSLTVSYYDQAKVLIDYLFKHYQPKKIALVYQNDDFGKDGLAGAKAALQKHASTEIVELPYERNQADFSSHIKTLEQELPDAIGFFSLPLAASDIIKNMGVNFLANRVLFGFSDLRDKDFLSYLQSVGLPFFYTSTLPSWEARDIQLTEEYKNFAKKHDIKPDPFSFEAYVTARIFFYLIEHVEGPVTKEKLIQAAEKIKNIDFKGLKLDFDPKTRVLLDSVWIGQNNSEPWVKVQIKEPAAESVVSEAIKDKPVTAPSVISEGGRMLTLGTSFDLSKTLKKAHETIKDTLTKIFEKKNKSGGVHGLLIRDIFLDDAYTPSIARQNYLSLLNEMQVDLIFGSRGTPTTQEALDLVKSGQMALLFLIGTESSIFRTAELKNAINLTPSFYEQGKALIDVLFQSRTPEKIAFFYQDDNFGRDGLDGAKEELKKKGFTNIIEIPYLRGQVEFSTQADIINKEKPDAIGFFSIPLPAMELIKKVGAGALAGKILFGASVLREQDFLEFMSNKGLTFVYANSLPDWQSNDLQIAQEYRDFASQNNINPDPFGFEAYIVAHLLFYLIEQIEGPVTKEKIIQAAENIHNYNFRGLLLDFNPAARILLNEVWIAKNNNEPWIKVVLDVSKVVKEETEEVQQPKDRQSQMTEEVKKEDEKPVSSVQGDVFVLGNTADVSKGLKAMSDALRHGLEAGVNELNRHGGVNGLRLKIVYLDDEYEPITAKENVQKFLSEYNTNTFISSVGTPTLESYIDLVINGKVAIFFPFTGSSTFRKPELTNLLNFGPSYDDTTGAATKYILKTYSSKRWVLLYQNDNFGIVPKNAIKSLLEKQNIKDVLEVSFERNDVNFTLQAKEIVDFKPEVIGFFGPAISAQEFIRVAGVKNLSDKILYGLPWLAGDKLQNFLREKGLKMIIPNVLPNPKTSELPIVKEFRRAIEGTGVSLDVNALEGYVNIRLFSHMLKQVEGVITIEKIMRVAESMKDVDFGGLKINYNPKLRQLSHYTWLDLLGIEQEWLQIDLDAESSN